MVPPNYAAIRMVIRRRGEPVDPGPPLIPTDFLLGFAIGIAAAAVFAIGYWLGVQ